MNTLYKTLISFFLFISLVLYFGCSASATLTQYEQTILENTIFAEIPHLQSGKSKEIISKNKISSMSFIKEYTDSVRIDSLTYLEFDKEGKLIRKTYYDECLDRTLRQTFNYINERIVRVDHYTYLYKPSFVREYWMEEDTTFLSRFDWEDYTYNGDTIIVESGAAVWEYIIDKNNVIKQNQVTLKTNNQKNKVLYIRIPQGIQLEMNRELYGSNEKDQKKYLVSMNKVVEEHTLSGSFTQTEDLYNNNGLLEIRNHYKDGVLKAITKIVYTYY
jgi:lipopolysaccharide export LptBFGC system permease protein LptF